MNHNSSEFERLVRDASKRVQGHLGDVREWHGIGRDDVHYFNEHTGRGGCDDDILDNVRDLVMGDLLDIPDHCATEAIDLSDAAAHAVHEYVLAEKLGHMQQAPTFCTCPPRTGAGVRTEAWEHARTCPMRYPLDPSLK